jgi:hypothetical protein
MSSLFSDVLLPGAAAVGLLVIVAVGPVHAGDEPAGTVSPAATVAANTAEPGQFEVTQPRRTVVRETAAVQPSSDDGKTCRRVERIGKTTARVCK